VEGIEAFLSQVLFAKLLHFLKELSFLVIVESWEFMLEVTLDTVLTVTVYFRVLVVHKVTCLVHWEPEFTMLVLLLHFIEFSDQEDFIESIFNLLHSVHLVGCSSLTVDKRFSESETLVHVGLDLINYTES
jgi:hypothetical protein